MADPSSEDRAVRRRLLVVGSTYLLAVLVSGLVLRAGVAAAQTGADPVGVPWLVVGSGGVLGAALVAAAALHARRTLRRNRGAPLVHSVRLAGLGRLLMLATAVVAAVLGVLLAPAGEDRAFAIAVSTGLAALLAVFALLANDLTRLRRRVESGRS